MVDLKRTLEALAANEIAIPEVQVMIQSLLQERQLTGEQLHQTLNSAVQSGLITPAQADRLNYSGPDEPIQDSEDEDDDEAATVI
ncbi:hypothetical protein, partial [Marinospirillum sp.]|uniref:hypothetical protein n=1 Tax=Marinospirillum sp. TaxID=2183934 RepID=UPI002870AE2A